MKSQQEAEMRVHKNLKLTDSSNVEDWTPSRPDVHVWHDAEDPDCEDGRSITIKVGAALGAQTRYISLSVVEARALGRMLEAVAEFALHDPALKSETSINDFLEVVK
jgi:hypothetical protein